jgi:hypothetical protein
MKQMLTNAIINALKFVPKGQIQVSAGLIVGGAHMEIRIRHTGSHHLELMQLRKFAGDHGQKLARLPSPASGSGGFFSGGGRRQAAAGGDNGTYGYGDFGLSAYCMARACRGLGGSLELRLIGAGEAAASFTTEAGKGEGGGEGAGGSNTAGGAGVTSDVSMGVTLISCPAGGSVASKLHKPRASSDDDDDDDGDDDAEKDTLTVFRFPVSTATGSSSSDGAGGGTAAAAAAAAAAAQAPKPARILAVDDMVFMQVRCCEMVR